MKLLEVAPDFMRSEAGVFMTILQLLQSKTKPGVKIPIANISKLMNNAGYAFSYDNIKELIDFHNSHGKEATLTATYPPGRFGALEIINNEVRQFQEKPRGDGALINGGYFVLSPKVFDRIDGDTSVWEQEPLKGLARENQLMAFKHEGFWQPMDTLRDKYYLEELLETNTAPWKIWED
jgi:glucose-1-phosphate cytidylyltransferase